MLSNNIKNMEQLKLKTTDYSRACFMLDNPPHFKDTVRSHTAENGVSYLTFPPFEKFDFMAHGFSTRIGGVSSGIYSSMNLTFNLDDSFENVSENFRRIGDALHIAPEKMVYSKQTHTTNVIEVNADHAGMGVVRERTYDNIDGLVTNEPGICLVTSYADCVPLFFADPIRKSIASSHSGWRGTAGNIAGITVEKMQSLYGSNPKDLTVVIGPSICFNCYEVSADVAEQFKEKYSASEIAHILTKSEKPDKYQLNLQIANYFNLIHSGVCAENIYISDICTCCNSDILFSHRATKGKRGILCGFIYIKE
jgi:hypothetical protein